MYCLELQPGMVVTFYLSDRVHIQQIVPFFAYCSQILSTFSALIYGLLTYKIPF